MRDTIGYCTNVHAGSELATAKSNLEQYAVPIRERLQIDASLPVGLWLAEPATRSLQTDAARNDLRDWLEARRLLPFTMNGFPQGDFHQAVVKHRVYEPTWWDEARRNYTGALITILDQILPPGLVGSISTLPIAWGTPRPTESQLSKVAEHFESIAFQLHQLWETTGREIVLAIEPEPGCVFDRSQHLVEFFDRYLSSPDRADRNRRFLGVCHDTCHAAVMFESQFDFLNRLKANQLRLAKVQVSAAVEIPWQMMATEDRLEALNQLRHFAEDRYLHQTGMLSSSGDFELLEDLPQWFQRNSDTKLAAAGLDGTWRVHYHVPLFAERFGKLESTHSEVRNCLDCLNQLGPESLSFTGHFEVETYAWGVLPESLRIEDLANGISKELAWFRKLHSEVVAK